MNSIVNRVILYPKDVMQLTGLASRTSRRLVADIKKKYDLKLVTIDAFCAHTRISEKVVTAYLATH